LSAAPANATWNEDNNVRGCGRANRCRLL